MVAVRSIPKTAEKLLRTITVVGRVAFRRLIRSGETKFELFCSPSGHFWQTFRELSMDSADIFLIIYAGWLKRKMKSDFQLC